MQGLQNILAGDQCMTVYKAIKQEADAAAELAIALAKGEKKDHRPDGQGPGGQAATCRRSCSTPKAITKDNVKDVVADGFVTKDELCTGDVRRALHRGRHQLTRLTVGSRPSRLSATAPVDRRMPTASRDATAAATDPRDRTPREGDHRVRDTPAGAARDRQELRSRAGPARRRPSPSTRARSPRSSATTAPASPPWSSASAASTPIDARRVHLRRQAGDRPQPPRRRRARHRGRLPGPRALRQPRHRAEHVPRPGEDQRPRPRRADDGADGRARPSPASRCAR